MGIRVDGLPAGMCPKEMRLRAQVRRADGSIEDRGTIAYWHRNLLRRIAWRVLNFIGLGG